ncbi:beta-xylosidase [Herbihabitans rhizosphaerae]|nr:beta-xylosidase [Herbihabitans rhizosphaerae]
MALTGALLAACTASEASPQADGTRPAVIGDDSAQPTRPAAPAPPPRPAETLGTDRQRASSAVVAAGAADAPYNYAPALMAEGGRYRMWWCSQLGAAPPPGDDVLYAESSTLDGPFRTNGGAPPAPVFSGSPGGFDKVHTCDPSVIKVGGTYYLYYTGAAGDHARGNAIGLATSPDGITWTRANNGGQILAPSNEVHRENIYGSGQPSALYLDGRFYLMFTDTTGAAAGWNGAGQFVLRSPDPAFGREVESLTPQGFRTIPGTVGNRSRSIVDAFSADWMWVPALDAFAVAHETDGGTTITFWDRDFRRHPYHPVVVRGPWQEGPGLARTPLGHAPPSADGPCDRVPVDLVRSTANTAAPTDMVRFGLDLTGTRACRDPAGALRALDGFATPSPQRTVDLVAGGALVRVERRAVADRLAVRMLERRPTVLDGVPVAARLVRGAPVRRAAGRGTAFLLDDGRLWPIADAGLITANESPVTEIIAAEWDAIAKGPALVVAAG